MAAPISAEEVAHRAASDAELIAWVDEQDRPLGSLPRAELRERGLIGRGTFILLFNSAVSDAPLRLQAEEISEARFIRPELALEEARSLPYCPDSLQALRLYLDA
ncbi:hypothetical protein ABZQ72_02190 [Pseudomonas aeruginosa]